MVYVAQLKCPNNHCVLAGAGEYPSADAAESLGLALREKFDALVATHTIKPSCAICEGRHFHIDLRETGFSTMDDAWPALLEAQRQQEETARFFKSQGRN